MIWPVKTCHITREYRAPFLGLSERKSGAIVCGVLSGASVPRRMAGCAVYLLFVWIYWIRKITGIWECVLDGQSIVIESPWGICNIKCAVLPCSVSFYFLPSLHPSCPDEKFHKWDLISYCHWRYFFLVFSFLDLNSVMWLFYLRFQLIHPLPKKPKISFLSSLDLFSGHFSCCLFVTCKNCHGANTSICKWSWKFFYLTLCQVVMAVNWTTLPEDPSQKEFLQSKALLILLWERKPISTLVFNSSVSCKGCFITLSVNS